MSPTYSISEICTAAKEARIPFDDGKKSIAVEDSSYDFNCAKLFRLAIDSQKKLYEGIYKTWTPSQIRTVKDFARQHGLHLRLLLPQHPSGGGSNPLSIDPFGYFLNMGLGTAIPQAPDAMPVILRHELGHINDLGIVILLQPEYSFWLQHGARNPDEALKIMNAFISAAKNLLPPEKQTRFAALTNRFLYELGPLTLVDVQNLYQSVLEAFRFGEEAHDPATVDFLLGEDDRFYWKYILPRGGKPSNQAVHIAMLQEAGVWEKFKHQPDFDGRWVASVSPTAIAFFRTMIRAGALHFYSPLVSF